MRIIVSGVLYYGPPISGNYHIGFGVWEGLGSKGLAENSGLFKAIGLGGTL